MTLRINTEAAKLRLKEATGQRATAQRAMVLALLSESTCALSHLDIEAALGAQSLDRVTLYRVLDWLVKQGIAHRISGNDRVWRFSITDEQHDGHAHFECSVCGKVLCLDEVCTDTIETRVPRGYHAEEVSVTVRGRCPNCD